MMATIMRGRPQRRNGGDPAPYNAQLKTVQWRQWRSINLTDGRTAIDDDDLAWLENVIPIGKGALKVVPRYGSTVSTVAAGIARQFGVTLGTTPYVITINTDGSITQVGIPGGAQTAVAPAGTVTTSARVTMWRNTNVLFIDPTTGYHTWDGAAFTTISALVFGSAVAVFEGRAWIASGRTISYTAPNTYNDFTAGNGAGSFILTDEAFEGAITDIHSSQETLWIVGNAAIDALQNVQSTGVAPSVVTTFSVTNVVTNLGSPFFGSVIGYFRALAFASPFGIYALSGVTPQKLSEKLDGLIPYLTFGSCPSAVAVVESLPCLCFLVTYTGSNLQSQLTTPGNTPILLCFKEGKWFLGVQNTALAWITTVVVNGIPQAWGCTAGGAIFQCFGADSSTTTTYKVTSKLYDHGDAQMSKALIHAAVNYQAFGSVSPTLTMDTEYTTGVITLSAGNTLTILNNAGNPLQILNNLLQPLNLTSQGAVIDLEGASLFGRFLGWSLSGTDTPLTLQLVAMEYKPLRRWDTAPIPV